MARKVITPDGFNELISDKLLDLGSDTKSAAGGYVNKEILL